MAVETPICDFGAPAVGFRLPAGGACGAEPDEASTNRGRSIKWRA